MGDSYSYLTCIETWSSPNDDLNLRWEEAISIACWLNLIEETLIASFLSSNVPLPHSNSFYTFRCTDGEFCSLSYAV